MREAGIDAARPRPRPPSMRRQADRFTTRRPVDPSSSQSVAGQVAAQTPYTPPMPEAEFRAQQRRQYDALQQRPRPVEAYQEPRNQFAEAGEYGLEMTGLPSIRRSAGAFADNRPREGFEEGALGLLGVTTLGVGGRGARPAPGTAPPMRAPQPPTRIYRGIVPDESRRSALGDRWWSDNPETASTYAPAAADGAHVVPGLLDESGFLAVEAPPGTMFRSIPVSSLPPEIRRAFPRTTQTVSTHEVAAAAESQGYRGVTFSGIRDGGYGGGPEPYGGFQTGDGGRVIAVFDDSMVQSPFPTDSARPAPPMRAPVAEPSGALRPPRQLGTASDGPGGLPTNDGASNAGRSKRRIFDASGGYEIVRNPSEADLRRMMAARRREGGGIRYVIDENGNVYAAPAWNATHDGIFSELESVGEITSRSPRHGFIGVDENNALTFGATDEVSADWVIHGQGAPLSRPIRELMPVRPPEPNRGIAARGQTSPADERLAGALERVRDDAQAHLDERGFVPDPNAPPIDPTTLDGDDRAYVYRFAEGLEEFSRRARALRSADTAQPLAPPRSAPAGAGRLPGVRQISERAPADRLYSARFNDSAALASQDGKWGPGVYASTRPNYWWNSLSDPNAIPEGANNVMLQRPEGPLMTLQEFRAIDFDQDVARARGFAGVEDATLGEVLIFDEANARMLPPDASRARMPNDRGPSDRQPGSIDAEGRLGVPAQSGLASSVGLSEQQAIDLVRRVRQGGATAADRTKMRALIAADRASYFSGAEQEPLRRLLRTQEPIGIIDAAVIGDLRALSDDVGGFLEYAPVSSDVWRVNRSQMPAAHRRQGRGVALYEDLIRRARENGVASIVSDRTVSADAARVYGSLRRRGYQVRELDGGRFEISTQPPRPRQ